MLREFEKKCFNCGREFKTKSSKRVTCDNKCSREYRHYCVTSKDYYKVKYNNLLHDYLGFVREIESQLNDNISIETTKNQIQSKINHLNIYTKNGKNRR